MRTLHHALFFLPILLCIVWAGCSKTPDTPPAETASSSPATLVRVQEIRLEPFAELLSIAGVVKALDDVLLSAEEAGVLKEWKAAKGQYVRKGAIIALLNDDVLRPSFLAAEAQYKNAEMNYQKQANVYAEQGISELQFKSAEYARDAAKAQADLARARWERTRVKSPVDGILDDHLVDEGEMTSPGAPVARIVNIDRVRIQVNVPERYASTLRTGAMLQLSVLAYPDETFRGKITHVGATVSADNRTIVVESIITNPRRKLKPEMIAKSEIARSQARDVILVRENLVQQMDQGLYVLFIEQNGKAIQRKVTLGAHIDGRVEVSSGLAVGDRLIISGFEQIADGQPVTVTQ